MRVGSGFDVHAFGPGDARDAGRCAHCRTASGVVAHSDGDVLLHALVDALLGAAGLGDIGMHFPDSDPRWRGADSAPLRAAALTLLTRLGYRVVNADLTLLAQAPKLGPWRDAIRDNVARLLLVQRRLRQHQGDDPEHLGFLGRQRRAGGHGDVLIDTLLSGADCAASCKQHQRGARAAPPRGARRQRPAPDRRGAAAR